MKKLLVLACLATPCWAADSYPIIALQAARIQQLERAVPLVWQARQSKSTGFQVKDAWQTLPGLSITYELKQRADVKLEMDGGVSVAKNDLHCGFGFQLNGTLLGNANYGDIIVMGELGTHWQSVSRTRLLLDQAPGIYTVTVGVRAPGSTDSSCGFEFREDYDLFNLYVTARNK